MKGKEINNTLQKIILVFFAILCSCCLYSYDYTPASAFEYTIADEQVTITKYIGEQVDVSIPPEIEGKKVTSIGNYAFMQCKHIKSVSISENVTSIGHYAFHNCSSLSEVSIPNSVTSIWNGAFSSCESLTSVVIPSGVKEIKNNVFNSCVSLTSIVIPMGVTHIRYAAFEYCLSLKDITIPDSVVEIEHYAFSNNTSLASVKLGNKVGEIGFRAFAATALTSVDIPVSVTYLDSLAFYETASLTAINVEEGNAVYKSIDGVLFNKNGMELIRCPEGKKGGYVIPNTVTVIGDSAFEWCDLLTSIIIPNSVVSIRYSAFDGCDLLTSIDIPDSVTEIGKDAFWGCSNLTEVAIGSGVSSIGEDAFDYCESLVAFNVDSNNNTYMSHEGVLFSKDMTQLIKYPASKNNVTYIVPDDVTTIGERAFEYCANLQSVVIPDSVSSINYCTFDSCSALKTISIGNGVLSIASTAFINCPELDSVLTDNQYVIDWFAEKMPHVKVESRHIDQTLELKSGWNWVSFQTLPTSHKVGDVLGTSGFTTNDVIQSSAGSSRFNGTSWIPSSFTLEYGKLYMVYVSKPVSVTLTGAESGSSTISVSSGWNWIANPTSTAVTPSQLTHSGGWTAGDCIQGASGSVTHSGSKWIPSTGFYLEPGKGYQIRSSKAGTISF